MFFNGAYNIFYSGGIPQLPKPGKYQLRLSKKAAKLVPLFNGPNALKLVIPVANLKSVSLNYDIEDKQMSAGKAIVGGVLAGGVGAIAGASMGTKKVIPNLHIIFTDDQGNEQLLSLAGQKLENAQNIMAKKYGL